MTMRIQEDIIVPAQDQQYQNFIVRYNQNLHGDFDYESDDTFQIVNDLFGILYVPEQDVPALEFNSYSYSSIPKCYTYMDLGALSASGVLRLHDHPYLRLKGAGTLVAVIDSGIAYQHPAFRNGDQSKILSIWTSPFREGVPVGSHMEENLPEHRSTRHSLQKIRWRSCLQSTETGTVPGLPP